MSQTLAVFHDAYRNLNAKKMFWLVLAMSGLVVAAFAMVGINEKGLKIVTWQIDNELLNTGFIEPPLFYKFLFVNFGIGLWLSWIGSILALVSTAGIFPDMLSGGSINLLLSKPLSRLRLFLTQYVAGLLFVTLQVTIFAGASFLVIGLRAGDWEPGLFMAIPLLVCFFSYLFSVCVLIGVATRSTLAALLLTLLFWVFVWGVGFAEGTLLVLKTASEQDVNFFDPQAGQGGWPPSEPPAENEDDSEEKEGGSLATAHRISYGIKTVLPKTGDTMALLERTLIDMAELPQPPGEEDRDLPQHEVGRKVEETLRSRSVGWVVGTSLIFEALVLALAAWIFCRRDY